MRDEILLALTAALHYEAKHIARQEKPRQLSTADDGVLISVS